MTSGTLPREQVGTRTYAVGSGAGVWAQMREIELTLLVREPARPMASSGHVVSTPDEWKDDVEVIHKPAQVIVPA